MDGLRSTSLNNVKCYGTMKAYWITIMPIFWGAILSHDHDTIHAEKGCVKLCDLCMIALVHHQNLESTWRVASCFPSPDDAPRWEMGDFHMGMGSCAGPCHNLVTYLDKSCIAALVRNHSNQGSKYVISK